MTDLILIAPLVISFTVTLFLLPFWIRKARQIQLLWDDMNKYARPKIPGSGGLVAVLGFVIGVLIFVAYRIFFLESTEFLVETFSLLTVILLLAGVGLVDDLFGWRKGGLSKRSRLILVAFSAIPLMAINAGKSSVSLPFIGFTDLGIIYPLILVPLGIAGATTTYNFLAGHNGLEAGQGILLLSSLGIVAYLTGNSWLLIISLIMVFSLSAFLVYNYFPARVFPGDSLTYTIGGLVAIISILGNFEKIAVFFFTPYIIETCLKLRGGLKKHSFGKPNKDGTLDLPYKRIYGLEHLSILIMKKLNIRPTETRVVFSIWSLQLFVILLGFVIFREGIF